MLKNKWHWQFMVKMLSKYDLNNFKDSYLQLGEATNDVAVLSQIAHCFYPIEQLQHCIISIFKEGIQPIWEDKANNNGQQVTFNIKPTKDYFEWFISFLLTNEEIVNGGYIKIGMDLMACQIWCKQSAVALELESCINKIMQDDKIKVTIKKTNVKQRESSNSPKSQYNKNYNQKKKYND